MKNFKSHFKFNKQERSGIFFLLLLIAVFQSVYYVRKVYPSNGSIATVKIDTVLQAQVDALKKRQLKKDTFRLYPFNPNFITNYKGYTLGLSMDEIDRLHTFRKQNKFANSAKEFQQVTLVSDSLLHEISPYFKFPQWVKRSPQLSIVANTKKSKTTEKRSIAEIRDLNIVTAEELKSISGIGEKLSARIIKFRDRLGGFLINDQLYDVYGLEPEVAKRALLSYKVLNAPRVQKIDINTASIEELSTLIYINYRVAANIVAKRNDIGEFTSFEELTKVEGFPSEKFNRIILYLQLNKKL